MLWVMFWTVLMMGLVDAVAVATRRESLAPPRGRVRVECSRRRGDRRDVSKARVPADEALSTLAQIGAP